MLGMNENTPTEDPTRVKLAHRAADIITGDRQTDYGPPEVNFQRIANLWNAHMETDIFTPRKVAEMMLLLKVARTVNSPTEDSYIDMLGYAAIAGELAEREYQNGETPVSALQELKNQVSDALEKADLAMATAVAARTAAVTTTSAKQGDV